MSLNLKVERVHIDDFDTFLSYEEAPWGEGSLTSPMVVRLWPITDRGSSQERTAWSIASQKTAFQNDPTAEFVKVVAMLGAQEETIALAKWQFYPDGLSLPPPAKKNGTDGSFNASQSAEQVSDEGWTRAYKNLISQIGPARSRYVLPGPCCFLSTLVTRSSYRRQGAGTLLLDWGIQQADARKMHAYLEADASALNLYRSCGFVAVEDLTFDSQILKIDDNVNLVVMKYQPGTSLQTPE